MRPFKLPEATSAQNIHVDFRINLIRPNRTFIQSPGPQFETLNNKGEEIKNKLVETIYNVDPRAEKLFKQIKIGLIIGVIIIFAILIALIIVIEDIYAVLAVGGVAAVGSAAGFNFWSKKYSREWAKKVVPKIVEYAKNDFKRNYETFDIHILYPIRKFSYVNGIQISADWMVIRITNGRLQQPGNAPVHWTSNGDVTPKFQNNIPLLVQMQQNQQKLQVQQQMEQMHQMQQQMLQMQQMLQLQQQNNNNQNTQQTQELPV